MARVTVEDCLEVIKNRFELVLVTALRTKQLMKGSKPLIPNIKNNKPIVIALREIAQRKIRYKIEDMSQSRKEDQMS